MESFHVVIPARYGSTRLAGKVLRVIAGRPLVEHVWRSACASGARRVIIATDDERVRETAMRFGAQVCMTRVDHASGTDRVHEAAQRQGWSEGTIVVNVQGDEPLMPPTLIAQVAQALAEDAEADLATARTAIRETATWRDTNVVKVVVDAAGRALYFSRAPIPWPRDNQACVNGLPVAGAWRHIGIYAYRMATLHQLSTLPACPLERTEALEQLRAQWHGMRLRVVEARAIPGAGVDTESDLQRVESLLRASDREVPR